LWGRRRFEEEMDDLETGLQADRLCRGKESTEGGFEVRELDLDRGMKRLGHNRISPHHPNHSQ
jgi:hypothetical protein